MGVLLGIGDGSFGAEKTFTGVFATTMYAVVAADVNGDGRVDVVAGGLGENSTPTNPTGVGVLLGDVPPTLLSIQLASPVDPYTSDSTLPFTVTFSKPVTGVDSTDFQPDLPYGVTSNSMAVQEINPSVYQVTLGGVTGTGPAGIKFNDNGHVQDLAGNPVQPGPLDPIGGTAVMSPRGGSDVVVGDVNGDGKPDMVVNHPSTSDTGYAGYIGVMLGKGDGTFVPNPQTFEAGGRVGLFNNLILADVNSDGKLDVILAQPSSNAVGVLFGSGNGTFSAPVTFATGTNPAAVAVSDLNGDGRMDVIVGNSGGSLSVLLGNGTGTFTVQQTLATNGQRGGLAVTDLNRDGNADLAFLDNGSIGVLLGNGDGTFQTERTFQGAGNPGVLTVADVNQDGNPDLVSGGGGGTISILLGNGDATFKTGQTFSVSASEPAIAVADVSADGRPDLIVSYVAPGSADHELGILLGNGNGTFGQEQKFSSGNAEGSYTFFMTVADLNSDGRLDVIVDNELFFGATNANYTCPYYRVVPYLNTINGSGNDGVTMWEESDHEHIHWINQGSTGEGRIAIDDPQGLTINVPAGGKFAIDIGDRLPNLIHLNGTVYLYQSTVTLPFSLAGTTLDLGTSTLFVEYNFFRADPISTIRAALAAGYNGGAWNGSDDSANGAITSSSAALDPVHYALGYADSADGSGVNATANTIEIKYTLAGDANLDGKVLLGDFNNLQTNFGTVSGAAWDQGDFNYDGKVLLGDFNTLQSNFGSVLPAASPAVGQQSTNLSQSAAAAPATASGPAAVSASTVFAPGTGPTNDLVSRRKRGRVPFPRHGL